LKPAFHFLAQQFRGLAGEIVAAARIGRHPIGHVRTEVEMQRQFRAARVQIPQRRIQYRDSAHDRASATLQQRLLVHVLPQALDAQRFLADELRREQFLDCDLRNIARRAAGVAEADALDALRRAHLDQAVVARGHRARGE
jgi:predicted ATPase with chaperone activity